MKRFMAFFLTLLLAFGCSVPAFAADEDVSGDWRYILKGDEAAITGYNGSRTDVTVPAVLDGHTVSEIGTAAFYRSKIVKLSVPSTVRRISWWAFYGSSKLSEVSFSRGLQTISYGAFLNCPSLQSVEIPPTVSSIGTDAFAVGCRTYTGIPDILNERRVGQQYYTVNKRFMISGYRGTAAAAYAEKNGLLFRGEDALTFADINSDGMVDKQDIILVENYIAGGKLSAIEKLNADLDCDGTVTQSDLDLLREYVRGARSCYDLPANSYLTPECDYLYGKKLYNDGDSVAKGTGTDVFGKSFHSYAYYLAEKYDMDFTTNAVGGTTLAKIKDNPLSTGTSILERVLSMHGKYDVILFDGGFNDIFLKVKLGEVTPDSDKSGRYDISTTAGALEQICYFLTKKYNDAVKLFVLCHYCDDRQPQYWETMRKILEKWEIPYIDISRQTDFRAVNDEINTQYFYCNDDKAVGDEIHPVAYAHDKIYGELIERKLNSLFAEKNKISAELEKIDIAKGETAKLSLTQNGEPYSGEVSWTSADDEIVKVNENGEVSAETIGEGIVRAETPDGQIVAFQIDVKQNPLCFYLNKTDATLARNQQLSLKPAFLEGTASQDISYESSNTSVAQVSDDGVVTAKKGGSAVITCKLSNGVKTDCFVKVR